MVISERRTALAAAGTAPGTVSSGVRDDLKPLTSLRFVAALLVFVTHAPLTQAFADRFALGQAGVGFFFVLSGFILTWNYHHAFAERLTWTAARNFYIARFARVYPTLVAATISAVIVLSFGEGLRYSSGPLWLGIDPGLRLQMLLAELTATKAWVPIPMIAGGVNPPSWSIADEAFFYALFPALAWYLLRAMRNFGAIATLAIAFVSWLILTTALAAQTNGWLMSYFPPIRLTDFVIGILVAIAVLKGARFAAVVEYLAILATATLLAAMPLVPQPLRFALALIPCWALLITAFAAQRGAVSRVLSAPILVRLGEVSFAFYLVHHTVIEAVTAHLGASLFAESAALMISLTAAYAMFILIEIPCRRAILGRLRDDFKRGLERREIANCPVVARDGIL